MKRLLITGGNGRLATTIAQAFASCDWYVDAPDRATLDITDQEQIHRHLSGSSPIDLLVCAAGSIRDTPLAKLSESIWNETISINYQGAAYCAAAALPAMIERNNGHIVLISSYSALHPPIGQVAYATAKAALLGLTQSLAAKYGSHNIRINAILPGFLETPMTSSVTALRKSDILATHHLDRFNTPDVVANFIHFLHHHLPHTSGQTFQLDSRMP